MGKGGFLEPPHSGHGRCGVTRLAWGLRCGVATFNPGQPASLGRAPRDGECLLSTIDGWEYIPLRAKEPIGFKTSNEGELLAVAGSREFKIPPRHHCWVVVATGEPQPQTAEREFRADVAAGCREFMSTWGQFLLMLCRE